METPRVCSSVEWSSRDTTGSVCSRALGRHAAGGAHGARAPGCVRARALRGGPPRARGVPPRGRRRRGRRRGVAVIGTRTAAARRRRCRRGSSAPASRAARSFDVREYPSAYVALRVMCRVGLPRLRAAGTRTACARWRASSSRRCGYALLAPGSGSRGRRVHAVRAHGRRRQRAGADRLAAAPLEAGNEREETKGEETNEGLIRGRDATSTSTNKKKKHGTPRRFRAATAARRRFDSTHPPPGGVFFAEHAEDELDYCATNRALPEDVRVTGWGYIHESFSARFDCEFRLYKYFFCAFPDPAERAEGPLGDEGDEALSGLDLDAMRDAARRFEGTHDFRNLCKMDARNPCTTTCGPCTVRCRGRRTPAPGKTAAARARAGGARVFATKSPYVERPCFVDLTPELWNLSRVPPPACAVRVEGSAFLWHQVRCMAAGCCSWSGAAPGKPQTSSTRCWTKQSSKTESRSTDEARMRRWCCGGAGSRETRCA